jgi:DNA-binding GntR family transcriptional regulator
LALTLDLLREAIVHAEDQPGQKLRIDHLGKALNASTGAVREALSRLTAEGLVVAEPQKGFIVAPISQRNLRDLTDVRVAIETRCLEGSIEHGDLDWEGRVLSANHKLRARQCLDAPRYA